MKNKFFRYYRESSKKEKRAKILFSLVLLFIGVGGVNLFVEELRGMETWEDTVSVAEAKEKVVEPTIQEIVFNAFKEEFGVKEAIRAIQIVQCESGFNPDAINMNKDKTIDRGIWQISNYHQKQVSNSCSFDVQCSTKAAIEIYKKRGNFSAWVCDRKLK